MQTLPLLLSLSIRQLVGGKRIWIIVLLAAMPVLAALLYRAFADGSEAAEFADGILAQLVVATVLPLVMLILATASFGNEIDDRTLGYLVLKPISRAAIVVPKWLASVLVGGVLMGGASGLALLLISESAATAVAAALAVLLGATAYGSLFTWAGLAIKYALPVGVAYVFVWEASLTGLLGGVQYLSVREYTLAIARGLDEGLLRRAGIEFGLTAGLAGVLVVTVVFVVLTIRKLRRMDVP